MIIRKNYNPLSGLYNIYNEDFALIDINEKCKIDKLIIKHLNYDELLKLVSNENSDGFYYIINHQTKHAIVLNQLHVYAVEEDDLVKLFQLNNILELNTDDFDNFQNLETSNDYYIRDDSQINIEWLFKLFNTIDKNHWMYDRGVLPGNVSIKDAKKIYRILQLEGILLRDASNIIKDEYGNIKSFAINNIFFNEQSEKPFYKEFFIDKDYDIQIQQIQYSSYKTINDTYFTYDIADYQNNTYGIFINLDNTKILKNKKYLFEFSHKKKLFYPNSIWDFEYSEYDKYLNCYLHNHETKSILKFYPIGENNTNYLFTTNKLLDKLKLYNIKTYDRIQKGLSRISEEKNSQILTYSLCYQNSYTISLTNIYDSNLKKITVSDNFKEQSKKIFRQIMSSDESDWVQVKGVYFNKKVIAENRDRYKFDLIERAYNGLTLYVKNGVHKMSFNTNEELFDKLNEIEFFKNDEEYAKLKCQYILTKQ